MRARRAPGALAVLLVIVALFTACDGDSMPDAVDRRGQSEPMGQAARDQPAGTALRPGPIDADYAMKMLRAIAEGIGPRFNGQPGEQEMIEFMVEALRGEGYEAAIEPFEFVSFDERHMINIALESGDADSVFSVPAVPLREGSSELPASAQIIVVPGVGTADDFALVDAVGAIAVVAGGELRYSEKQRNAAAAGAIALIIVDLGSQALVDSNEPGEIPVFFAPDAAGRLLLDSEGATATISEPATEGEFRESWNVVARRAEGVCRVVVGGHYDSVRGVQGANDNASGIAVLLALARAWVGATSAADVCFVGFGAEELGLHGSAAFVAAARASGDLAEITAMLNLDAFGNGERPIVGTGSDDVVELFGRVGGQLGIEVQLVADPLNQGSDHAAFYEAGVPVIFPRPQGGIMHAPADNVDNVDATLVRDVGLLAQAMLECLLERAGSPIEPRLSCDAELQ